MSDETNIPKDETLNLLKKQISFHIQWQEFSAAEELLGKYIQLTSKNEYVYLTQAVLKIHLEKFAEAAMLIEENIHAKHEQLCFAIKSCNAITPASEKIRHQLAQWVQELITLQPLNIESASICAAASLKTNTLQEGIQLLEPFLKDNPENFHANIILANLYTKQGNYHKTLDILKKTITRKPIIANCKNHIAYQLITYDEEKDQKPQLALKYALEASNESNQKIEDIEDTLALAYYKINDLENACLAQQRAVKNLKQTIPPPRIHANMKLKSFQKQLDFYIQQKQNK